MENFVLLNPTKLIFGNGNFKNMRSLLRGFGKRTIVITGGGSVERLGYLNTLNEQLASTGKEVLSLKGIRTNPKVSMIDDMRKEAAEFAPELIIALGGGSVIDAAKAISVSLDEPDASIWEYVHLKGKNSKKPSACLPLITIPTVAATGSEFDPIAVISNDKKKIKAAMFHLNMFPAASVVDPELTYSCGPALTAWGGVDIISHIAEGYFLSKGNAPLQDEFTESMIKRVMDAVKVAQTEPANTLARETLSYCSSLALSGFINSGRKRNFVMHSIEHSLSAHLDIHHGLGLALIMPHYLREILPYNAERLAIFAENIFGAAGDSIEIKAMAGIASLEKWLRTVGINKEDLDASQMAENLPQLCASDILKLKGGEENALYVNGPLGRTEIIRIISRAMGFE